MALADPEPSLCLINPNPAQSRSASLPLPLVLCGGADIFWAMSLKPRAGGESHNTKIVSARKLSSASPSRQAMPPLLKR
eukprot:CAMPEP_0117681662 /NCGR_PEP_ID=MMETSP0804-20121206/19125_1 /TAXON_ID=1074897 /ORGANISM="Tetraselmis astigmatica, Strain CCMP880" /LENGTH=78 /DNA_ID=CAMNT_0005491481 /DNA_START=321 /DNA_END=557 /DNA_ORIENTATION=+